MNGYEYRNISYIFLGFWGILLVVFLVWKSYSFFYLKRTLVRLTDDEVEFKIINFTRLAKLYKLINYLMYFIYLVLIICSMQLLINVAFYLSAPKDIFRLTLILLGVIFPSHFAVYIVFSIYSDIEKALRERARKD